MVFVKVKTMTAAKSETLCWRAFAWRSHPGYKSCKRWSRENLKSTLWAAQYFLWAFCRLGSRLPGATREDRLEIDTKDPKDPGEKDCQRRYWFTFLLAFYPQVNKQRKFLRLRRRGACGASSEIIRGGGARKKERWFCRRRRKSPERCWGQVYWHSTLCSTLCSAYQCFICTRKWCYILSL